MLPSTIPLEMILVCVRFARIKDLSVFAAVNHRLCSQLFPVCNKEEMAVVHEHKEHHSQAV